MNKSKMKPPKKKVIPLCFKRKNKSNTSVASLLHIASYKKYIKELTQRNKYLAKELAAMQCKLADQTKILQKNACERNQIMLAKLKFHNLAKTMCQLSMDLDEVRQYLDIDLSSNEVEFQTQKGSSCKIPSVESIQEVSAEFRSEHSVLESTPSPPSLSPLKMYPAVEKRTSIDQELDPTYITPTLDEAMHISFTEKEGKSDKHQKKPSTGKNEFLSLTPTLDIESPILAQKKSSARRRSQLFKVSDSRNHTSTEVKVASLHAPNSKEDDMELTDIISVNPIIVYDPLISKPNPSGSTVTGLEPTVKDLHTETCKDHSFENANSLSVRNGSIASEITFNKPKSTSKIKKTSKLRSSKCYTKTDLNLDISVKSISNDIEDLEPCTENQFPHRDSLKSPLSGNTNNKVSLNYVFSPSDSESDSSNFYESKENSCRNRNTAIFIPKTFDAPNNSVKFITPPICSKAKINSPLDVESIMRENDNHNLPNMSSQLDEHDLSFSVNSHKDDENERTFLHKKHKLSRQRKNTGRKTPTKSWVDSYNVKSKKNSIQGKKNSVSCSRLCPLDQALLPEDKIISLSPVYVANCSVSKSKKILDHSFNGSHTINTSQNEYKSALKQTPSTPKSLCTSSEVSDIKRVSFAPTDTVCKFKRMSYSKQIAAVSKVRRASKSFIEVEENQNKYVEILGRNESPLQEMDLNCSFNVHEPTELYTLTNARRASKSFDKIDTVPNPCIEHLETNDALEERNSNTNPVFNLDDQTELYTFSFPSQYPRGNLFSPKQDTFNDIIALEKKHSKCKPNQEGKVKTAKSSKMGLLENSKENVIEFPSVKTSRKRNSKSTVGLKTNKKQIKDVEIDDLFEIRYKNKASNSSMSPVKSSLSLKNKSKLENKFSEIDDLPRTYVEPDIRSHRRRSKAVSYKEPSLNKKMRRS